LQIPDIRFIPLSALRGDNVVTPSENLGWYQDAPLLEQLETISIIEADLGAFRYPVQHVIRPNLDYRGFAGTIASGSIRPGDEITALPSGKSSRVKTITTFDGDLEEAVATQAVTLTLEDELDISRGDMLVSKGSTVVMSAALEADLIWMSEAELQCHKEFIIKFATQKTTGSVSAIRYKTDVNTLEKTAAETLQLNEIGCGSVTLTQPVVVDAYRENRITGAFIIIDRFSNSTVGVGMVRQAVDSEQAPAHDTDALRTSVREKLEALKSVIEDFDCTRLQQLAQQLDQWLANE
jgi:sulfate adenylyltransferase subunit 1